MWERKIGKQQTSWTELHLLAERGPECWRDPQVVRPKVWDSAGLGKPGSGRRSRTCKRNVFPESLSGYSCHNNTWKETKWKERIEGELQNRASSSLFGITWKKLQKELGFLMLLTAARGDI